MPTTAPHQYALGQPGLAPMLEDDADTDDDTESGSEDTPPPLTEAEIMRRAAALREERVHLMTQLTVMKEAGMKSDVATDASLDTLRDEVSRMQLHRELKSAVQVERNMIIGAVGALEWFNRMHDPVGAKLDGWSTTVSANVQLGEYDLPLEKIFLKWRQRGLSIPPELELAMAIGTSALMYHHSQSEQAKSKRKKALAETKEDAKEAPPTVESPGTKANGKRAMKRPDILPFLPQGIPPPSAVRAGANSKTDIQHDDAVKELALPPPERTDQHAFLPPPSGQPVVI